MPNRTLYVGPRQDALWKRAEIVAQQLGLSLSSLVTRALREHLDRPQGEAVPSRLEALERRVEALELRAE